MMNLDKIYHDSDGEKCNILQMLKREPEWAANMLQRGEIAMEVIEKLIKLNPMRNDFDMYLFELCEFSLGNRPEPNPKDYGILEGE
jgi:hypothetical protein